MSSRELVDDLLGLVMVTEGGVDVIVEATGVPDDSALNTALRGGDWSAREYREARIINELASSRADGRDYMPDLLQSPGQLAAEQAQAEWQKRRHAENLEQLRGKRPLKEVK